MSWWMRSRRIRTQFLRIETRDWCSDIRGQHKIISRLFYESLLLVIFENTVLHGIFAGLEHHIKS
jgi:hypothetical protein